MDVGDNITPTEGRTPAVGVSKRVKTGVLPRGFKRPKGSDTLDGTTGFDSLNSYRKAV